MTKYIFLCLSSVVFCQQLPAQKVIARQGKVAFFSHTTVEDIKAENNQVLSIIDIENGKIAVSMLMNTFVFKKALMREHFNESYVESDIYPKATFEGAIDKFEPAVQEIQTRFVKGIFTMHGVSKELEIKIKIHYLNDNYVLTGSFEAIVEDYEIRIPPLLAGNIADVVSVEFRFEFEPYEE